MTDDIIKSRPSKSLGDLVLTSHLEAERTRDVAEVTMAIGTRHDRSFSGVQSACAHCGAATFTSRPYPQRIKIICEICFHQEYRVEDTEESEGSDP